MFGSGAIQGAFARKTGRGRPRRRLIFDVSTAAYWQGPPSGIDRLQSRLVGAIARVRPDAHLVIFDPGWNCYRTLDRAAFALAADPRIVIRPGRKTGGAGGRGRPLPRRARQRADALSHAALEARHYGWGSATPLRVPMDWVAAEAFAFAPGDMLVDTGAGWSYSTDDIARALKDAFGIRYVAMCHDIIPLIFPEWCGAQHVATFRRHFLGQVRVADAMLFHSRRVAEDAAMFVAGAGLGAIRGVAVPVGVDRLAAEPHAALPPPLAAGRYILAVGTIEPRKGHRMLLDVWRRLRAAGVPERHDFTLVFAGKPGWLVDAFLAEIRREADEDPRFRWLPEVDDALLDRLYRDAAFCAIPSLYEGYGLPAVEAFAYGKALLCSNRGALPEVAGALCPCLDPADSAAWEAMLGRWMAEPAARAAAEAAVRDGYKPMTWEDSARRWIGILEDLP